MLLRKATKNLMKVLNHFLRKFFKNCAISNPVSRCTPRRFAPYVFNFDTHTNLKDLLERGVKVIGYLSHLGEKPMSSTHAEALIERWNTLAVRLQLAPTALGGLDNNARNVVIADENPTFIDFASIGWNWQEMRLVQLFNSIGAFLSTPSENANFVSLLDRELVNTYAEWVCRHRETCFTLKKSLPALTHITYFFTCRLSINFYKHSHNPKPPKARCSCTLGEIPDPDSNLPSHILLTTDLSDDTDIAKIREMIGDFRT